MFTKEQERGEHVSTWRDAGHLPWVSTLAEETVPGKEGGIWGYLWVFTALCQGSGCVASKPSSVSQSRPFLFSQRKGKKTK